MTKEKTISKQFENSVNFDKFNEEIEVKYLVTPDHWDYIQKDFLAEDKNRVLEPRDERTNTYYSAKNFVLYQNLIDLRSVPKEGRIGFDFKTPYDLSKIDNQYGNTGMFRRREYEKTKKIEGLSPLEAYNVIRNLGPKYFKKHPELFAHLKKLGLKKKHIEPIINGRFQRDRLNAQVQKNLKIEMAFELGHYATLDGKHESDLMFIIEPEVKEGTLEDFLKYKDHFEDRYGVTPAPFTKGQMGVQFAVQFMSKAEQELFAQIHSALYPGIDPYGMELDQKEMKKAKPLELIHAA